MKIAIVAAKFTASEADELRRSMATFKAKGKISFFEKKLIDGMVENGYTKGYAQRVFRQLEGFGSYGFPESHAVSFALLVYVSSWLKCHYPDVFACALLNSMPMGFYQPAQIVIDAKNHGVEVRPVDINYSDWDNKLEKYQGRYRALRLGFRQVKGLKDGDLKGLILNRKSFYKNILELREAGVSDAVLERLADADAFRSIGYDRRRALWEVSTKNKPHTLFSKKEAHESHQENISLPKMRLSEHVLHDYASTSLSLKAHPVSFVREDLRQLGAISTVDLSKRKNGDRVKVAGLTLVRQRPGTASGICFITIEDESGTANLVVFQKLFDQYRKEIIQAKLLMVEGQLQIEGEVIHVIVSRCYNLSQLLVKLTPEFDDDHILHNQMLRPDETTSPPPDPRDPDFSSGSTQFVQGKIFHEGRNFR